jgi:hypothetical protein
MSSSSSVDINVASSSSNDVLSKFPSERERFEFPDYLLKAESFFSAKDMLDVINTPIVPETRAASDTTVYLGVESSVRLTKHPSRSYKHSVTNLTKHSTTSFDHCIASNSNSYVISNR